jgi:hypothetical protein
VWSAKAESSTSRPSARPKMASSPLELRGGRVIETKGSKGDGAVLSNALAPGPGQACPGRAKVKGGELLNCARAIDGNVSRRIEARRLAMAGRRGGGARPIKEREGSRKVAKRWKRMGAGRDFIPRESGGGVKGRRQAGSRKGPFTHRNRDY